MGSVARFKRIYIEITSTCNLSCSFCQETRRPAYFMSIENFRHILENIKPYTNYIYLHVKGEPALHPHFREILKMCREYNLIVNLTTNGTLIKKRLPDLLEFPVHQINVSMHSADDNDCIDISTYINELFECCNIILDKTETEISLRLWNTKKSPTLFGERNCTIKRHLYVNVQSPFEWPELDSEYYNERGFCQGLRSHIAILSNGTVTPCCLDGNGVMNLGNIFTTPLSEILENERSTAFREGFKAKRAVEPLCCHCSFKERFNHKM